MSLRDAAASIQAKPVIAAAIVFTVLGASWHGWNVHDVCTHRAAMTEGLRAWAQQATAASHTGTRLDSVTGFEWDSLRISQGESTPAKGQNCPFGWHWDNDLLTAMADAGNLTLIGFFSQGRLVEIADFDRVWAEFETDDSAIDRDRAVFVGVVGTNRLKIVGSDAKNQN